MIKRILCCFIVVFALIFSFLLNANSAFASSVDVKPLKMEQNLKKDYTYGNFDKTFQNDKENASEEFNGILEKQQDRKEPTVLDVFNSLIFVIMLILLTGWIYMKIKRINPEQLLSGKFNKLGENTFKIVSSLQLGAGKAIYLIEINEKQLIVGTTSNSVNLLAKMEKNEKTSEIPQECIEKLFDDKNDFKKLEE